MKPEFAVPFKTAMTPPTSFSAKILDSSTKAVTRAENLLIDDNLSEYHTGYRALSRKVLETVSLTGAAAKWVGQTGGTS